MGWFRSSTKVDGTTFYDPPQPITRKTVAQMDGIRFQGDLDLYHLPDPEPGLLSHL